MINIGVVGCGYWGKNHIRVFKELEDAGQCKLNSVCDVNDERAMCCARKYDANCYRNYEELAENEEIDAVSVVTQNSTHYQIAKKLLRAGKDVLLEKPVTLNSEKARELAELADREGRVLQAGHIFRHHPSVGRVKREIDKGTLGEIYVLYGSRLSFRSPRIDSGTIWNLGIHEMDTFCYLLGVDFPEKISTAIGAYLQRNVEEIAFINMKFKNNIMAHAFESWISPNMEKVRSLTVIGSQSTLVVDYLTQKTELLSSKIIPSSPSHSFKVEKGERQQLKIEYKEPLKTELQNFIRSAQRHEKPLADGWAGYRSIVMVEKAYESALNGKVISFQVDEDS